MKKGNEFKKIGIIGIVIILMIVIALFTGCTEKEQSKTEYTKIGVIKDAMWKEGKDSGTTILFEDGTSLTIYFGRVSVSVQELYLKARNNIGNKVKIVYRKEWRNRNGVVSFEVI